MLASAVFKNIIKRCSQAVSCISCGGWQHLFFLSVYTVIRPHKNSRQTYIVTMYTPVCLQNEPTSNLSDYRCMVL